MEMFAFVGGVLLIALIGTIVLGIIAAIGWFLLVIVLPTAIIVAVGYFGYHALKVHLARQGRDISEFIPALPLWTDIPAHVRESGAYWAAFLAGGLGLILPAIITASRNSSFNAVGVLTTLLVLWWAIPLAVYNLLNAPTLRNELRFPSLAFLTCFAFSLAGHIHPVPFLFLSALTAGYGWWWYEHHPYLKMLAVHRRCKEMHDAVHILSIDDFMANFHRDYRARWGFDPSNEVLDTAGQLYAGSYASEVPALPEMPPFLPAYPPAQDITARLTALETTLRELPSKQDALSSGITDALNRYTSALQHYRKPCVLTVAAWEVIDNLPQAVSGMVALLPAGAPAHEQYWRNRDAISRDLLTEKAYLAGIRIEPTAYAQA